MSAALPLACRACGAECDGALAPISCAACGALLPVHPQATPFSLLGLGGPRFVVDPQQLERAWLARSRRVHPDRFATKGDAERRAAAEQVAALNDAKRAIFEPYERASWLVAHARVATPALDPALLVETIELREQVEAAPAERAQVVDRVTARFHARLAELHETLSPLDALADGYAAPSAPLRRAAALLAELKVLARLAADLGGEPLIATLDAR